MKPLSPLTQIPLPERLHVSSTQDVQSEKSPTESIRFGFYLGAGFGLAIGSAVAIPLGDNLIWQSAGLFTGGTVGIALAAVAHWQTRLMRAVPAAAQD